MRATASGWFGIGAVCALTLVQPALGAISVVQKSAEYKIIVDPATVDGAASIVLVWDTEDRGETLDGWAGTRDVTAQLTTAGGEFYTPIEGIPEGSVVRAIAKRTFRFYSEDGYVQLSGNQYFVTDLKENATSGMEMTFVMMGGSAWCPLMAGTHDGFTVGRRNTDNYRTYIRCHDGNEIGVYASFTANAKTVMSLKRGGEDGKSGVLSVNGSHVTSKAYPEIFVLYNKAGNLIHLGTSVNRANFTNCKWYEVKFWDAEEKLVRDYVPVLCVESGVAGLYEKLTQSVIYSAGSGSAAISGTPAGTLVRTLVASPVATAVDPLMVVRASWTGLARNGNPHDPANWACTNLLDEVVENGLPGSNAVVSVTGEINLQLTEGLVVTARTVAVNAMLADDTDWQGHFKTVTGNDVLQAGSALEMNGHALTIAGSFLGTPNQVTLRNSATGDPATLRVVTPEGTTCENKVAWLKGNLRLEKQGAGTYVPYTQKGSDGSDFTGGAYLLDGLTRLVDGSWWRVFGGDNKIVHVGANATLDTAGGYHVCNTPIFLDGGTILQSKAMSNQDENSFGHITLTADSKFRVTANTVINTRADLGAPWADAVIDLGGKELWFDVNEVYLDFGNVVVTNGSVKVTGSGMFRTDGANYHALKGSGADFDIEAKWIELYSPVTMHDFTCRSKSSPGHGNPDKNLQVFGTFRPVTPHFPKVNLMDGATLSLVDQTGSWSVQSACVKQPLYRTVFPETGTINVDVTGRTDLLELGHSDNPYLVTWREGEVPTDVHFRLVGAKRGYSVIVRQAGLRLLTPEFFIYLR